MNLYSGTLVKPDLSVCLRVCVHVCQYSLNPIFSQKWPILHTNKKTAILSPIFFILVAMNIL